MDVGGWLAEYRPLLATLVAIAALLALILRARMPAFAALILVSALAALAAGMAPADAFDTLTRGMGGTLGFVAVVIGLGALFGVILERSGGLESLAQRLLAGRQAGSGRWLMGGLGLLASIPVFFDVALIILAPLVFAFARQTGRPALAFGLPLLCGLAVAHSFIPPTPGPIAVAEILGADLGLVILFGLLAGLPALALAGPLFAGWLDRAGYLPVGAVSGETARPTKRPAKAGLTAALISLPLLLILAGTLAARFDLPPALGYSLAVIGHPFMALLLACGLTWLAFRPTSDEQRRHFSDGIARALEPTGAVILVTGAGGAFKQVLVDTGAGAQLAEGTMALGLVPLVAGFVLALLVRVAQGSATVAMITAAGLTAPLADAAGLGPAHLALCVIAIAAGATALSHVNDSGFWLVSRIFGLDVRQTLASWTIATLIIGLAGFAGALILSMLV
jgi:Gnt-I system low-affinity gluconate transporter